MNHATDTSAVSPSGRWLCAEDPSQGHTFWGRAPPAEHCRHRGRLAPKPQQLKRVPVESHLPTLRWSPSWSPECWSPELVSPECWSPELDSPKLVSGASLPSTGPQSRSPLRWSLEYPKTAPASSHPLIQLHGHLPFGFHFCFLYSLYYL